MSSSGVDFGSYDPLFTNSKQGSGTTTVSCSVLEGLVALGAATNRTYTVYGLIALLQSVEKGLHNDSVVISIIY